MEYGGASAGAAPRRRGAQKPSPYKGIRMRKWGKWVAEIREPKKRSRIWLGSYSSAVAAARAYDTALYYLRGPAAKLNFPDQISASFVPLHKDLSPTAIRQMAAEVGSRVDAGLQTNGRSAAAHEAHARSHLEGIDLNKEPEPEEESGGQNEIQT